MNRSNRRLSGSSHLVTATDGDPSTTAGGFVKEQRLSINSQVEVQKSYKAGW